jgi:hypothetical protein
MRTAMLKKCSESLHLAEWDLRRLYFCQVGKRQTALPDILEVIDLIARQLFEFVVLLGIWASRAFPLGSADRPINQHMRFNFRHKVEMTKSQKCEFDSPNYIRTLSV